MKKIIFSIVMFSLAFGIISCVEDEVYKGPANIESVSYLPNTVTPTDPVIVTAKITDLNAVTSAKIEYTVNGTAQTAIAMIAQGSTFTGTIPVQADLAKVVFSVVAVNTNNLIAKSSEIEYTVGAIPIDFKELVINEVNGIIKFIELYNKGAVDIPMKGIYLEKDGASVWTAKDNLTVKAGKYLVLYSNKTTAENNDPDLVFASGLSGTKAVKMEIFTPAISIDAFNLTVDSPNSESLSYSRSPNGTGKWYYAPETLGLKNPEPAGLQLVGNAEGN